MSLPSAINAAFLRLKSSSNSNVFEGLKEIRKCMAKHEQTTRLIRENRILEELVRLLSKSNERNLDLSLSILGNCCLEHESRLEVFHLGIVGALKTVLNIDRDSIQGRACRLIGNLSLLSSIAVQFHKENIVSMLANVVENGKNNSPASRHMAVRALRILWNEESKRNHMLEQKIVYKVALLLSTPYEMKDDKELLKAVVKALAVFTQHRSDLCAKQVLDEGSGFVSLISLWERDSLKESVVMCVYNLCHIGSSRPILGTAGIVKIIVRELSSGIYTKEPTESQTALISSLCLLCRESVNRAKIRRAGGLPIILAVLRDSPKSSLQFYALNALVQFVYDESSLQELLKQGMINVLVTKLRDFVNKHGREHEECPLNIVEEKGPTLTKKRSRSMSDTLSSSCVNTLREGSTLSNDTILSPQKCASPGRSLDLNIESDRGKRFRVTSPSYKAVVQELGYLHRYKDRGSNPPEGSPKHSSDWASLDVGGGFESYSTGDWSPGSPRSMCLSPGASSPSSNCWNPLSPGLSFSVVAASPPSSPMSATSMDYDIPEVYSPICQDALSDEDSNGNVDDNPADAVDNKNSKEASESTEETWAVDDGQCNSPRWNIEIPSTVEPRSSASQQSLLLVLISRISHMETIVEDLASFNTFSTILDYIRLVQNPLPRAGRILARIVRSHHYFLQLVSHHFALCVYSSLVEPAHSLCSQCDKLTSIGKNLISNLSIIAETGFGEGELCHHLLKGDDSVRKTVAFTIPFIVKTHRLLKKLLINCKGLDVLRYIINHPDEYLSKHISTCLSLLAGSLNILSNHKEDCEKALSEANKSLSDEVLDSGAAVVFILDDGERISANKTFLCEHSPVFEAMLHGAFKESHEKCIRLHDISAETFTHLIFVMKLGIIPHSIPNLNLTCALELLLVLDRFLVPGNDDLTNLILRQFLQPDTAIDVYVSAYNYMGSLKNFNTIRVRAIEFLLVTTMCMKKRKDIFSKLLQSSCSEQVQSDLFNILQSRLENNKVT